MPPTTLNSEEPDYLSMNPACGGAPRVDSS